MLSGLRIEASFWSRSFGSLALLTLVAFVLMTTARLDVRAAGQLIRPRPRPWRTA
jgi:hypothetical protein